jgi:hypothetical protein
MLCVFADNSSNTLACWDADFPASERALKSNIFGPVLDYSANSCMCACAAVQAASGNGGGIAASVAGDRALSAVSSAFTNNSAVSGGALYVTGPTNGVAVGAFSCDKCTLKDNRASSKVSGDTPGRFPCLTNDEAFSCYVTTGLNVEHLEFSVLSLRPRGLCLH